MKYQAKYIITPTLIALFFLLFKTSFSQNYKLQIIADSTINLKILKNKSYKKTFKDSLNVFSELEKTKSQLIKKGYISASFDSVIFNNKEVKAFLYTGKKYTFQITESKDIKTKTYNNYKFIEEYENIIKYYENNGYPFACIKPKNVKYAKNNKINIEIEIEKNKLTRINKLIIKGEPKISETFIKRYLSVFENDFYNESIISAISSKLENLNFVSQIRKPEIEFFGSKADVYIYLKEKKANNFNGIIGFIPDKNNENKLSFTGNINLLLINNLKKGEEISLNWNKTNKHSQKLNIATNMPYIFKSPFGTSLAFNLDKIDTSYMTISGKFGINYSFKNNDKIITYAKKTSSYILTKKNIDTTIFKNTQSIAFGLAYKSQRLNYIFNPSKGYSFITDFANGKRTINSNKFSYFELNASLDFYIPLFSKFVYKVSTENKYLFSKTDLLKNELYKVGGFYSLRGFDEDEFYSSQFTVLRNEIRFLYERNSNIYIFTDIARIEQLQNNVLHLTSFGLGTNFNTKAGIFSISYALGKEENNPIQLSNSKIHLGYVNRF